MSLVYTNSSRHYADSVIPDSYPWWPAVIFEEDDPDVPGNILQGCREAREKRKMKLHILRFFDKNQSWYATLFFFLFHLTCPPCQGNTCLLIASSYWGKILVSTNNFISRSGF